MHATAPTRKMSIRCLGSSGVLRTVSRILPRPDDKYTHKNTAPPKLANTPPAATPCMPSCGSGPQPRPSAPPNSTCAKATTNSVTEGTNMLPLPRITEDSVFTIHTKMEPKKATSQYATAWAKASPLPPSADIIASPNSTIKSMNTRPSKQPIHKAWTASTLARAASPAPKARLTADDTPPPMAPADIMVCSITNGNTNAMPAKAGASKCPT